MNHWLMKSEPDVYSFADLMAEPDRTTLWDGVRNYQARNMMRGEMAVGDLVLFYHSNTKPPGLAGICEVASEAYPDPTQFDPKSKYFDAKSDPENPRWWLVDVRGVEALPRYLPLDELRTAKGLEGMALLRRGQRLSVQPVSAKEFAAVKALAAGD